ncbi:MAG: IS200/IS605 family transposase [Flavisolibacter sp.]|nr:IS200/IS605 family transposase [Flavisolibacter sp.]
MPNTYSQLYIQIVFAVKGRKHFIKESIREEVQKYITGIVSNKGQKVLAIYSMPDHIHILISMSPDCKISDLVRDIKANSSSFVQEKISMSSFRWQEGYGAFSYAKSQIDNVVNYILNQQNHHKQKTFKEEYVDFLNNLDIIYKEEYLFEFYQ